MRVTNIFYPSGYLYHKNPRHYFMKKNSFKILYTDLLVAYYKFDGDLYDSINSNNLYDYGGTGNFTYESVNNRKVLSVQDATTIFCLRSKTALNVDYYSSNSQSFGFWLYIPYNIYENGNSIFGKRNWMGIKFQKDSTDYYLNENDRNPLIALDPDDSSHPYQSFLTENYVRKSDGTYGWVYNHQYSYNSNYLEKSKWNFVFFNLSGNTWKFYFNGNMVYTYTVDSSTGVISYLNNPYLFLGSSASTDEYWYGKIANLQIYKQSLEDNDVLNIYNNEKSQFGE